MSISNYLKETSQVIDRVDTWEKAIEVAAQPLINLGKIKSGYVDSMVENIKNLGPYIILLPGVAMPHARPDENVLESSLAFLKINEGVKFSEDTDKVYLMFVLAAKDSNSHIEIIEQLTDVLGDDDKVEELKNAKTLEEVINILK